MVTFEQWEMSARFALADRGIGYYGSEPIIAGVRAHCLATGQSPAEAFGDPRQFADDTMRSRMQRPSVYLTGQLFLLSLGGIAVPVLFAMIDWTLQFAVSAAGLTGFAALILASFAAWGVPQALRSVGRPGAAVAVRLTALLLGAGAVPAYLLLPHDDLFTVPVPAVIAVAVGVLFLSTRRGSSSRVSARGR
ncbi:MAG TPA: hypothetical protein VN408_39105 [Actinoplanes sp.]|nr:hypothetical protein [Actinoplanes sp.]